MRNSSWRLSIIAFGLGVLIATVAFAPAQWLAWAVAQGSGARVQLQEPMGTVWSGSARLVLGGGSGSIAHTALPGRLQWRLWPNLRGVQLALRAPCCFEQEWLWHVTPSWGGAHIRVENQKSAWPSALLSGLGTPWNTLQFKGTLELTTQELTMQWLNQSLTINGQLQLDATNMSTILSPLNPIGSYRVQLIGGEVPTLNVSTLEGSLKLSGAGRWVAGRLQFDGEASAAPGREQALANLLNILGQREGARAILKVG